MRKHQVLIVMPDVEMRTMLHTYLTFHRFEVVLSETALGAVVEIEQKLPDVMVVSTELRGLISGWGLVADLRQKLRLAIPTLFILPAQEYKAWWDKRGIVDLEITIDDYISDIFDIVELRLHIEALVGKKYATLDRITLLPTCHLIEQHLKALLRHPLAWVYINFQIVHLEVFIEMYGYAAAEDVLRFTALLLNEKVEQHGTPDDYVGQLEDANFVIITHSNAPAKLMAAIQSAFLEQVKQHYSFIDRERGYLLITENEVEKQVPLMILYIGLVNSRIHQFQDVREITELAAENRRKNSPPSHHLPPSILAEW